MKGFWAVPKSIAEQKNLSFKAKLIAGILWTRKNSDFEAFPSRKYMANALGVSIKTVERGVKELKEKAGLKVERKGLGKNNRYLFPDWTELSLSDETTLSPLEKTTQSTPIVRDNIKDSTFVGEESPFEEIIAYFKEKVKRLKGFEPEICWKKDVRIVKGKLKRHKSDEIKELIDWYLSSPHSEKLGCTLSVCLSTNIINLWKASKSASTYLNKLYPTFHG